MDLWDRDAIDLGGQAIIEITADGRGSFRFIAVEGFIDARRVDLDGRRAVEFSWDGYDEGDQGGCLDEDGSLRGHLFVPAGEDSGFRVVAADLS